VTPLFEFLRGRAYEVWASIRSVDDPSAYLPLLRPVGPYDAGSALSPLASLGVLLALAVSSGVALASLGVLLLALLVIHVIFTEVLGITIEVRPPAF
jgi:hypothetical protein